MAGKATGRRKAPAATATGKGGAPTGKKKAAATAKRTDTPKAAPAKPKTAQPKPPAAAKPAASKPAPAKAKPAPATTKSKAPTPAQKPAAKPQATPAANAMLTLSKDARLIPGCGFGIGQSVMLGALTCKLPGPIDLDAVDAVLEEFALVAPVKPTIPAGLSAEMHVGARIHAWHMAIQRGLNVPVFGGSRLWESGGEAGGVKQVAFAVPSVARASSVAAMQFVIDAIVAVATSGGGDGTRAGLRKKFAGVRQTLGRHALVGLNAIHFAEAAHALGIERAPWTDQIWSYGVGRNRVLMNSSVTSATPQIGVATAKDKLKCSAVLRAAGLPVARNGFAQNADTAVKLAEQLGYPVVIKPADMDQGAGVTAGIADEADLRRAFEAAAKVSRRVMIEKHHDGRDYRVTVLNGKVIKIMDRRAGGVTGDGKRTVAQLVERTNQQDKADRGRMGRQRTPMVIDEEAQKLLAARGFAADSVLPEGEFVALRRRSNISAGGTYQILPPESLHPHNHALAINAAAALGLDLAGIDVISADPAESWRETGGIIVEVNAQPQIGYRDTEQLFGDILRELIGGDSGAIPLHLIIVQDGVDLPNSMLELARANKCNAASWGNKAWIQGAGLLGPFANAFRAGKSLVLDPRVEGAMIAMAERDVLQFGLPAARFTSIRLMGKVGWKPLPALPQLIEGHAERMVRQNVGLGPGATA